jgi:hypothetical protein
VVIIILFLLEQGLNQTFVFTAVYEVPVFSDQLVKKPVHKINCSPFFLPSD